MAGGSGTRLWPASVADAPKQLLRIGGRHSLFQQSVLRAAAATADGPIAVVTNHAHVPGLAAHLSELTADHPDLSARVTIIPEPTGRNTAPAIAVGMACLQGRLATAGRAAAGAAVLVLSADHVIAPIERFVSDATVAAAAAAASVGGSGDGRLVCFGIRPTHPETGFGYIKRGAALLAGDGECYAVDQFKEKPDQPTAARYLAEGDLWNAGMFCFNAGLFWRELERHQPSIARAFSGPSISHVLEHALSVGEGGFACTDAERLARIYQALPAISIDNAVLERSDRVAVVPASFTWSDVGSWDAVAALQAGGPDAPAPVIRVQADGSFVRSEIPVALCGVDDVMVVIENGRALVCRAGAGQLVKQAVDQIRERGLDDLL